MEIIPLNIPKKKVLGNWDIDLDSGEVYIKLYDDIVGNPLDTQMSIWFPFSENNDIAVLDKKLPNKVILDVAGNYIGGFFRVKGYLNHIWTMDRGKSWNEEVLPNYFFEQAEIGFGNNQIWMSALVSGKKGVKVGTYLVIGTIKP
jgi:hypothetical protein